jgi:5'-3' exonuclease
MKMYRETFQQWGEHILLPNTDDINLPFLLHFLDHLSMSEDDAFRQAEEEYFTKSPPNIKHMLPRNQSSPSKVSTTSPPTTSIETFESKKIDFYPAFHKSPHRLFENNRQGWRTNYYYYLFDQTMHSNTVSTVCASYIRGLSWCCDYYFKQSTDWAWYYRYNYSPTILDTYNYVCGMDRLQSFSEDVAVVTDHHYIKLHEQLLMVIPPASKYLLPNREHQSYMTDLTKGVVHLFPVNFKIGTYLKYQFHECGGIGINIPYKLTVP